jgi:two-component system, sensor histidine kinase ChiS
MQKNWVKLAASFAVIIITAVLCFVLPFLSSGQKPSVENANITISSTDFYSGRCLNLDGKWEFYWQRFLNAVDIKNAKPDLYATVPCDWNNYTLNGKELPGQGYATYRLHVTTDVKKGEMVGLCLNTFSSAYRLMVDNKIVAANGTVGKDSTDSKGEYKPLSVSFEVPSNDFDIIIQVSNYQFCSGGFWFSLYTGNEQAVNGLYERRNVTEAFILGILAFIFLNYLISYLKVRRLEHCSYMLTFLPLVLLLMVLIDLNGQLFIYKLLPAISFNALLILSYLSMFWVIALLVVFTWQMFQFKQAIWAVRLIVAVSCIMSLLCIFTPPVLYHDFFTWCFYFVDAELLFSALLPIYGIVKRHKYAILYFTCQFIFVMCYVCEMLQNNNMIGNGSINTMFLGICVVVLMQCFVQSQRISDTYAENIALLGRMQDVDKLKDDFLANTSHELRTPLNGIINIAFALQRNVTGDENKKQLSLIVDIGKRLSYLVNDILDYSRLKNNDIAMNAEAVNLKSVLDGVLGVFRHTSANRSVAIVDELPDGLPEVTADRNRLTQIFFNLVGNAVKFTDKGSVIVTARQTGDMMEICVKDTGIGIKADRLAAIFSSFEQADRSIARRYGGTGLGLSITKQLVGLQGGQIWVKSTPGQGSAFTFTLPLSHKEKVAHALAKAEAASQNAECDFPLRLVQGGPRILIVDDSAANLYAAVSILKLEGYSITAVTNGKEALEVIGGDSGLSLVILDVMMPDMSGYDICAEIRKHWQLFSLPVLMLTAKDNPRDIAAGFKAGANDYLGKPIEAGELTARVRSLTELKSSADRAITAELKFLQSQIRPHFIYNALNTISSISLYDAPFARKLLVEFSKYLRNCFDFKNLDETVPLEHELEHVRSYLTLEQARFGDRLKVNYQIGTEVCDNYKIPPLILQPLVENAVVHGLLQKPQGGSVIIKITKLDDILRLEIKDDGVGMTSEKINEISKGALNRGVGLGNIKERLKKLYDVELSIKSTQGKGTDITIELPIDKLN